MPATVPSIPLARGLEAGQKRRLTFLARAPRVSYPGSGSGAAQKTKPPHFVPVKVVHGGRGMSAPIFIDGFGPSGPAGTITTVAGTGTAGTAGDGGGASSAQLSGPTDVTFDNSGSLLVTEGYAHSSDKGFRKITTAGVISTVPGSRSAFSTPVYMAVAPNNSLYYEDGYVLARMTPPSSAQQALRSPLGEVAGDLVIDATGNVYYGSAYGIDEITASGSFVNILNGTVCGIAFNQAGELLFTGWSGNAARQCTGVGKIDVNDNVTQLASGLSPDLNGITVDSAGSVFLSRNHDYYTS
jgi:hypothetical protein